MKQLVLFIPILFLFIGCQPKLTYEKLDGLWYDEMGGEELYFKGDSLGGWGYSKYEIFDKDLVFRYENGNVKKTPYQYDGDTLFYGIYDNDGEPVYFKKYVKIPFKSTLEYELDKKGFSIDFFEGETRDSNWGGKGIGDIRLCMGFSKENELVVFIGNKQLSFDSLEKNLVHELAYMVSRTSIHQYDRRGFHSFMDKNVLFKDYMKVQETLLLFHRSKNKFHIIDKRSKEYHPSNYNVHNYFPASFLRSNYNIDSIFVAQGILLPPQLPLPPTLKELEDLGMGKIIYISWNNEGNIAVNENSVDNDDLYEILKSKYIDDPQKVLFAFQPTPLSKMETYLFVRNTIYKINKDLREEFAQKNYQKTFSALDQDIRKSIQREYPLAQTLDNWR